MLHFITDFIGIFFEWIAVGKKNVVKDTKWKGKKF
jgi:hypothetical protein